MNYFLTKDQFYPKSKDLRAHFEKNFSTRKDISSQRFVWDYWYVENQYKLLRTPAYEYFPKNIYNPFHQALVDWGRKSLGCHDVSPTWLSYYIDGFSQNLHSDVPHGPWAFVYSLTPKIRKFSGGETLILKPEVLNYWNHFLDDKDREENSFFQKINPNFNRLTVFDPRFPHGVSELRGTQNPLEARLVIHGWFVEPRPYVVGALSTKQVQGPLEESIYELGQVMPQIGAVHGTASLRLDINKSGQVKSCKWLTNTTLGLEDNDTQSRILTKVINKLMRDMKFPKARAESKITVPLMFK